MKSQHLRRHNVGNFQISVMNYTDIDFVITATTIVNTILVGTIKERAVVEDGQVVARPISYLALHCDHAIVGPKDEKEFMEEVLRLMAHPEEME